MADTLGQYKNGGRPPGVPEPFRSPVPHPGHQPTPPLTAPEPPPLQPVLPLTQPGALPAQPAPGLTAPAALPAQPAPGLTQPEAIPFQPPPALTLPAEVPAQPLPAALSAPAPVPLQPVPALTAPAAIPFQPAPGLTPPSPVPFQAAPPLTVPSAIPLEPAPALTVPAAVPFQPAPPLATPAAIPFQPAPPLTTPAAVPFEPAPPLTVTAALGPQPAPPLSVPAAIPFEPAPGLTVPASLSFQPAPGLTTTASLPFQAAPGLTATASLPPPPAFAQPPKHEDIINAANKEDNTIPGIVGSALKGFVDDIAGMLTNIDIQTKSSVATIPGIGGAPPTPIPLDIDVNTHGGKINVGIDLHLRQVARAVEDQALSYGKAKAQAVLAAGVSSSIQAATTFTKNLFGGGTNAGGVSPALPTSQATLPAQSIAGVPRGTASVGLLPGPKTADESVTLPDATVEYVTEAGYTYNADSRVNMQTVQTNALRATNHALGRDVNAPFNPANRLEDFFNNTVRDPLQNPFNVSSGSDNRLTVKFPPSANGAESNGFYTMKGGNQGSAQASLPDDDLVYLPLVFTDLRPLSGGNQYRTVYFRPFIKSLNESFSPSWNLQNYFGRVDPVATYMNTNRNISLAFTVTCFSHDELVTMYQKLSWLKSMVYPLYSGKQFQNGPVVRMRVGDVINAVGSEGGRGLPGIITSLTFDYNEATWELNKSEKLPRLVNVDLAFQVLHEGPVGLTRVTGSAGAPGQMKFGVVDPLQGNIQIRGFHAAFSSSADYLNDIA